MQEAANRNQAKAEEERRRGDKLFTQEQYSDAVKAYTEAIQWNPDDPKAYSNRAACHTKLAAFELALEDCKMCINVDPSFTKGYVQKGMLLKEMRRFEAAMEVFQVALEVSEGSEQEALSGYRECMVSLDNDPDQMKKQALTDPEVQKILSDPEMRRVLDLLQSTPEAAREQLMDPAIASKIQKLMHSGLITFD